MIAPSSRRLAVMLVLGLAARVGGAHADTPQDRAVALVAEATAAYQGKDFARAAERFAAAYRLDPQPTYLFNQAQAHRLGGQCVPARDSYQLFLEREPTSEHRVEIEGWIAEQQRCALALPEPEPLITIPPPAPPLRQGRSQRLVGLSIAGLGLVGVGIGCWGVTRIGAAEDDLAALYAAGGWGPAQTAAAAELESQGRRGQTMTWLGLGVGGAAVITGSVLYVLGRRSVADRPALVLVPTAGGALAMVASQF